VAEPVEANLGGRGCRFISWNQGPRLQAVPFWRRIRYSARNRQKTRVLLQFGGIPYVLPCEAVSGTLMVVRWRRV